MIVVDLQDIAKLQSKMEKLKERVFDLSPLWEQLAADWFRNNQVFWSGLRRKAKRWDDLKESTKKQKQRVCGFAYPVLFRTGRLAGSLSQRNHPDARSDIQPHQLTVGTATPYAIYHQMGTRNMAARTLFEPEVDGALMRRWIRMADAYLEKTAKGLLE